MSWVGLRDRAQGTYAPAGLGHSSDTPVDLNGILPRGTVMVEFAARPGDKDQVIFDYQGSSPWTSGLSLTLSNQGILTLTQTQGNFVRVFAMATGIVSRTNDVTCTFTWDAPARTAEMSVEVCDKGHIAFTKMDAPLPVSLRDAVRLVADPKQSMMPDRTKWIAIADTVMPHGPLPSMCGETSLSTPSGERPLSAIKPGQIIHTVDGKTAQVRWVGSASLPARGRFLPMRLNAPYHGATRDFVCSAGQQLRFSGSEVEYLFATETVCVGVGQLTEGVHRQQTKRPFTKTYYQILLDRPQPIACGGLLLESFNAAPLLCNSALRDHSVLKALPSELIPQHTAREAQRLRNFEALTLCRLKAA